MPGTPLSPRDRDEISVALIASRDTSWAVIGRLIERHPTTVMREVIAEELTRIDDERLSLVTVTAVDVDPEMNRAIIHFDSLFGEEADADIVAALGAHRVRLQSAVGKQIRSKKTPILSFKPDTAIRSALRIEEILHNESTLPVRPADPEHDGES